MECRGKAQKLYTRLDSDCFSMSLLRCLVALLVQLMLLGLIQFASAQHPGFKSVDCGCADAYEDHSTGVEWVTDEGLISTGEIVDLMPIYGGLTWPAIITSTITQLQSLRRFPEKRNKHCYTFDGVIPQSQYLIRATFYYSDDSDGLGPLNHTISFQLSIDSTVVETIVFDPSMVNWRYAKEYIIQARAQTMFVCLIPVEGVPFINALEIRPILKDMYLSRYGDEKAFLVLSWRMDCGVLSTGQTVRFPDDKYDRYWDPPPEDFDIFNTSTAIFDPSLKPPKWDWGESGWNNPPNAVLNSAWDFRDSSWVRFSMPMNHKQAYVAIYTVNLNASDNTEAMGRNFSWYIDGDLWTNVSLSDGRSWQLYNSNLTVQNTDGYNTFLFETSEGSVLGPILNGAEAYGVYLVDDVSTHPQDENAVESLKKVWTDLKTYTGDPCLPVPYDWINCSTASNRTTARIVNLDLSNMQLTGEIPSAISDMTALEVLRLNGNQLSGGIPDFTTLQSLQIIHLESNNFTGKIPASLANLRSLRELYLQNTSMCNDVPAYLNRTLSRLEVPEISGDCSTKKSSSVPLGLIIGVVVGGCALALLLLLVLIFFCLRKRRAEKVRQRELAALGLKQVSERLEGVKSAEVSQRSSIPGSFSDHGMAKAASISIHSTGTRSTTAFGYEDLRFITKDFSELIGRGGYGPVYRGKLPTGQEVAIKINALESDQGQTEFFNEVELLSRVHHRNILPLTGYCAERPHEILVYQYMSNGTLHQHLHEDVVHNEKKVPLEWSTRVQIALGAARGLDYLHADAVPKICHRDVKSSNILLDENFNSKVGDFGISKSRLLDEPGGQSHNLGFFTCVKGSRGYLDPEYYFSQRLTFASDVYSFGVVLLEIITGKQPNTFQNIVEWSRKSIREGNVVAVVDPVIRTGPNYASEEESLWRVAELALSCTQERGMNRPSMGDVVQELTAIVRLLGPNHSIDTSRSVSMQSSNHGFPDDRLPRGVGP